jgi:dihydrofolate reductase
MPRKLTAAVFVSLDGVMQAPGGPTEDPSGGFRFGGWTAPFDDESAQRIMAPLFEGEHDLLLGRRTYDIFAAYWPYHQDVPVGATFQRVSKFVATHSDRPLEWENSQRLHGELPEAVARLKASEGRDVQIWGSSTLYPPLLAAGLIDQMTLIIHPVLLGQGKRLFGHGAAPPGSYRLTRHAVSDTGVIGATYEPAGELRTGTMGPEGEPSEAELRRRQTIEEGTW